MKVGAFLRAMEDDKEVVLTSFPCREDGSEVDDDGWERYWKQGRFYHKYDNALEAYLSLPSTVIDSELDRISFIDEFTAIDFKVVVA